jgi:hypothetical protein
VVGSGDEPLPALPVRVWLRASRERGAQHRALDVVVPELAHHARHVDAFREGELLVRVADAVPPRQREVLDEQGAKGVHDAPLGYLDGCALAQPALPVLGELGSRGLVRGFAGRR